MFPSVRTEINRNLLDLEAKVSVPVSAPAASSSPKVVNLNLKKSELTGKFNDIATAIKAEYDFTETTKAGDKDALRASMESFKAKNEQKRTERSNRFDERLAELKKGAEERSTKLKERLEKLAPPSPAQENIFEKAAQSTNNSALKNQMKESAKRSQQASGPKREYKEKEIQRVFGKKTEAN